MPNNTTNMLGPSMFVRTITIEEIPTMSMNEYSYFSALIMFDDPNSGPILIPNWICGGFTNGIN